MKTIIAGTRTYENAQGVFSILNRCPWAITQVVSGGCRGVDKLGERWADTIGVPIKPFPYKSELGTAGGPVRNKEMAEYAEAVIVFWDGESRGTKNMIDLALEHGLHMLVVRI